MALAGDLTAAYGRLPRNVRGALWMTASAFTFTLMSTLVKYLGEGYPPALQTFYRQAAAVAVLAPSILRNPRESFRTTRIGMVVFRSAAGVLALNLMFYSFQKMGLAEANALSFTRVLWLVPIAALLLGEKVGPTRIGAAIIGFGGVVVMLQPAMSGAEKNTALPAAAALSAAFLTAFTIAGMKVMTRDHSTRTLLNWSAGLGLALAIPPALFVWRWPAPLDFALLAAMGMLGLVNQACYIKGMMEGDAAAMAPVDYTRMVFAIALGYALFRDVPSLTTLFGAGIVIASTLYITIREARVSQPRLEGLD